MSDEQVNSAEELEAVIEEELEKKLGETEVEDETIRD
jgi:hypothetical protein